MHIFVQINVCDIFLFIRNIIFHLFTHLDFLKDLARVFISILNFISNFFLFRHFRRLGKRGLEREKRIREL